MICLFSLFNLQLPPLSLSFPYILSAKGFHLSTSTFWIYRLLPYARIYYLSPANLHFVLIGRWIHRFTLTHTWFLMQDNKWWCIIYSGTQYQVFVLLCVTSVYSMTLQPFWLKLIPSIFCRKCSWEQYSLRSCMLIRVVCAFYTWSPVLLRIKPLAHSLFRNFLNMLLYFLLP